MEDDFQQEYMQAPEQEVVTNLKDLRPEHLNRAVEVTVTHDEPALIANGKMYRGQDTWTLTQTGVIQSFEAREKPEKGLVFGSVKLRGLRRIDLNFDKHAGPVDKVEIRFL